MSDINYLLKRTSTADKRPTAAQLDIGELALNYEGGDPGIYFEDSNGAVRKVGPVTVGGTAPNASPAGSAGNSPGELWLDNSGGDNVLKVYDGTNWQTAASDINTAAGSDTQVQFNNGGALAGDAGFTYNSTSNTITVDEVVGRLDGAITFTAQADQALVLGDVVYISGASGDTPTIDKARANSATTMPAYGLVMETIASGSTGQIVTLGSLEGSGTEPLDTSGLDVNDVVYVSATTAGEWTTTKPTGEGSLLQNIGRIQRVQSNNGVIKVGGAGRTNATPNLDDGNIFIGNGSNQATTQSLTAALSAQAGISSAADAVAVTIDSSGNTGLNGELTVTGNINANGNIVGDQSTTISGINVISTNYLTIDNINLDATATELNYLDGSTPGTATASNAVVLDSNKDATGINSLNSTSLSAGTIASPFQASAANDAVTKDYADSTYVLPGVADTSTTTTLTLNDTTATFTTDVVQTPSASVDPASNGDLVVEATSNTTITFKLKGSDGTVRTGTVTLS